MTNLLVTPTSRWKSLANQPTLTVTHQMEDGRIGVAWIEDKAIVLGGVERRFLFENYEQLT